MTSSRMSAYRGMREKRSSLWVAKNWPTVLVGRQAGDHRPWGHGVPDALFIQQQQVLEDLRLALIQLSL